MPILFRNNDTYPLSTSEIDDNFELISKLISVVTPSQFGAVGDGVADDTVALLSLFSYCSATHTTALFAPGTYTTTKKLPVTGGFHLLGPGFGDDTSVAAQPNAYPCSILWTGVNDGTDYMIDVKSATAGNFVYDFFIHGVALRGNNKAYGGIRFASTRHSGFGDLWVDRCRVKHFMIDCSNAAVNSQTTGRFLRVTAGSNAATLDAVGFEIFSDLEQGNTRVHIDRIEGTTQNGDAVVIGNVDSSTFTRIQTDSSGGKGLRLRGTTGSNTKACRKVFIGMYGGSEVYAEDGSKSAIAWVNSEGTSVTCEAGASLDYSVLDRKNGRRFSSARQVIDDKVSLFSINAGLAHTGTPVIGTLGAQAASGILFDAASTEAWQWTFRPPRRWHTGWVTGFEITGIPVSDGGGNIVWQVGVASRPLGTALGAALTSESFTVAAPATAILDNNILTFATPIDIFNATDTVIVRLSRLGGDGADTLASDYMVIEPRIIFRAAVADSDSPVDRYDPSDDVATVT